MRCLWVMLMLVVSSLILLITTQADMTGLEKREAKRYCGETLNDMLMFICDSVYKRSEVGLTNWNPNEPIEELFTYGQQSYFPFKSRDSAVALIPRQYKRQGVADECCRKPCTLDELSTYCGVKSR